MGFKIRSLDPEAKLPEQSLLEGLESVIPYATVQEVVTTYRLTRQRCRKLSAEMGLLMAVGMNLWARQSLTRVLIKLIKGFRFIWPDETVQAATKGAISQLRYEVGAAPVVELFHRICVPMATQETPGAFLFGYRLMAIDGKVEEVADTPANAHVFGRSKGGRGESAFPLVRGVYLMEVGTHGIVDAGFWPYPTHEQKGARRVLRSVKEGMLVMWDRGLHSFDMVQQTLQRQAHFLGRVPATVDLKPVCTLPDGSSLAFLRPSDYARRKAGERILVRVIEYTIDDPALPGYGERHVLITSLLDEKIAPARTVAQTYHERWEIELAIDEMDTHQRLASQPLRSKKPVGVIQELYGLLLAHYAVRKVMYDAAGQEAMDPDRMSFINALELICDAISEFQISAPQEHERLYQRLLEDIRQHRLPERDHRWNPRVVKRKMSKFPRKRPIHQHIRQPCRPFRESVVMLN